MNITALDKMINTFFANLNCLQPVWWLLVRLCMALVFFSAGLARMEDFDSTVLLFAEEYNVQFLSPALSASITICLELACSVMLIIGLTTRFAALLLLIMVGIAHFIYLDHILHYYWAILLSGIILHGPGKLSLDHLLALFIRQRIKKS